MEKKIHKVEYFPMIGKKIVCGTNASRKTLDDITIHWEEVTCKNCLKQRDYYINKYSPI